MTTTSQVANLDKADRLAGDVGLERLTKVLFLCLARNCARTLPIFFDFLNQLDSSGFACTAIIGENGSSDETRLLIEKAVGSKIALLDTGFMAKAGSRLKRMAIGRQALVDAALARGLDEDFVCIADLDNVMVAPPPLKALRDAIASLHVDPTLFAIGAASRPVYYDLLSLRAEGYEFLADLYHQIEDAKKRPWSYYSFHRKHIYRIQQTITGPDPVVCTSSFNGFCLYRASDCRLGSYRAPDEAEVCEHVNFNLSITRATGKRMMIAPYLAIQAPADHKPVDFLRFWFDRLRKRLL
jgi:hypothetical protein